MKRVVSLALSLFALAALGACASDNRASADAPPYRSPTGSLSGTPQSPNSLPEGASVNSPITSRAGNVQTTPVAPSGAPAGQRSNPYR